VEIGDLRNVVKEKEEKGNKIDHKGNLLAHICTRYRSGIGNEVA
jgi:hypothetical protein